MRRATAAALAAAGLLLAGCSGDPEDTAGTTDGAAPTAFATATATGTPVPAVTTPPASTATAAGTVTATAPAGPKAGSTDFGYFTEVVGSGSQPQLAFDRATFLTGEAAQKAAEEHGDTADNDYYVVNDNTRLRTLTLAAACDVIGSSALNSFAGEDSVEPRPRTVEDLLGFVDTEQGRATGFHLVYGDRGLVVRVEEQYVP